MGVCALATAVSPAAEEGAVAAEDGAAGGAGAVSVPLAGPVSVVAAPAELHAGHPLIVQPALIREAGQVSSY